MHYLHPWKKYIKKIKPTEYYLISKREVKDGCYIQIKRKSLKEKMLAVIMGSVQKMAGRFRVNNGCVYISKCCGAFTQGLLCELFSAWCLLSHST